MDIDMTNNTRKLLRSRHCSKTYPDHRSAIVISGKRGAC
jgi:hypothetical protein